MKRIKKMRNMGAMVVSMLLVVAMMVGLWPMQVLESHAQTSDTATAHSWKEFLGEEESTQYAGRIWTDKSVYSEDASFELYAPEGESHLTANIKLEKDEDFLVAYSALATAQAVSGQTQAPVDVVFIVDISGSMNDPMQDAQGNSSKRIAETVKALNTAVDSLMKMNKNTRVGVVTFSSTSQSLLPLAHYQKGTRGTVTDYFSLSGTTLYAHVTPVEGYDNDGNAILGTPINEERTVTGGTNIQRGIHQGMTILAEEQSITAVVNGKELQRYPSVVLLSDGAPTYSSNDTNWWNPANNSSHGPGSGSYYGNGMKALMTGAYMKNAIDRNYKLDASSVGTTFYTIGMGINGLSDSDKELAHVTLNPAQYWEEAESSIAPGTYTSVDFDYETSANNTGISSISCSKVTVDQAGNATATLSIQRSFSGAEISGVTVNGITYNTTSSGNRKYSVNIPVNINEETAITLTNKSNRSYEYTLTVGIDRELTMPELISEAWNIYAKNGTPVVTTKSNQTYTFGHPLEFDILGTYTYKVVENKEEVEKEGNALQALVNRYYDADDASSISTVFHQIVSDIALNTAQVPTAVQTGKPLNSTGWIIYEDPIGEYMEVKSLKQIIYGGHQFALKQVVEGDEKYPTSFDVPENTSVYIAYSHLRDETNFDTQIHSGVYAGSDAADIIVMVQEETVNNVKKQKVIVRIPAANIPVRINMVTLRTATDAQGNEYEYVSEHTNNGTYPVRVVYGLGLQDHVMKTVSTKEGDREIVNTEIVSPEYLEKYTDLSDGSVKFFSNFYDGKNTDTLLDGNTYTAGNAKVTFVPAHTNAFYFLQEDMPIYTDSAFQNPANATMPLNDDTLYYYKDIHYHMNEVETTALVRTGAQMKHSGVIDVDGVWHRKGGTPRLNRIVALVSPKTVNLTDTAQLHYAPQYDSEHSIEGSTTGHMTVWLGNNGVLKKSGKGILEISKTVTAEDGLTAPIPENGFEFTVTFKNDTQVYDYDIVDTNTKLVLDGRSGQISNGEKLYLNDGETARIFGLDYGTEYVITETPTAGYQTTSSGTSGTITVGVQARASFQNHYSVTPVVWPADDGILGTKTLKGRQWGAEDTYTFHLTPFNGAILPDGVTGRKSVTLTGEDVIGTTAVQTFDFGQVTFSVPGVYHYTVGEEKQAANSELAGISYSRALYHIVVTVEDNGKGALVATSDIQKLYDDDGTQLFEYDSANNVVVKDNAQDAIAFVNTYSADSVTKVPVAVKAYTDKSGQKPLTSGMFEFKLTPNGILTGSGVDTSVEAVNRVPMPVVDGVKLSEVTTRNEGVNITFLPITYTQDDLGTNYSEITYQYKVEELPGTIPGMTYTDQVEYIDVKLSIENHVLRVQASYENLPGVAEGKLPTFENIYEPSTVNVTLEGQKTLVGRDMKAGEYFEFCIEDSNDEFTKTAVLNGNIIQNKTKVQVTGGKADVAVPFDFGAWTFKIPGTFRFEISETVPAQEKDGITYDSHVTDVEVVVADENGQLKVTSITYDNSHSSDAVAKAVTDKAVYVNTYKANFVGAGVSLEGIKTLEGQSLEEHEFRFGMTTDIDVTTGKADANAVWNYVTNQNGQDQNADGTYEAPITFLDHVTYTETGTYTYIIREDIPDHAILGMTIDTTVYKVVVVVKDNGLGALYVDETTIYVSDDYYTSITPTWVQMGVGETITFHNTYAPIPITYASAILTKVLEGNRSKNIEAGEFAFKRTVLSATVTDGITLMQSETVPADPANDRVTNMADGTIAFGPIKFTKAGTYVVRIAEEIPSDATYDATVRAYVKDGVYYEAQPITITYIVEDDQRGTLSVRTNQATAHTFVNTYEARPGVLNGEASLMVTKELVGRPWNNDTFLFALQAADDATRQAVESGKVVLPAENYNGQSGFYQIMIDNPGQKAFGNIVFKTVGTYAFEISEIVPNVPANGIIYDTHKTLVKVTVQDNGEGQLVIENSMPIYEGSLTFVNQYIAKPTTQVLSGIKKMEGRELLDTDKFTFTLNAVTSGAPMPTNKTVQNEADGTIAFGEIEFDKAGTYVYEIRETGGTVKGVTNATNTVTATVTVTDDLQGQLHSHVTYDAEGFVFVNTYQATPTDYISVSAVKKVTPSEGNQYVMSEGTFEFMLSSDNKNHNPISDCVVSNDANGNVTFISNAQFDKAGTYVYVVQEKDGAIGGMSYSQTVYTITIIVSDDVSNAKLTANISVEAGVKGQSTKETVDHAITKDGNHQMITLSFENQYNPKETDTNISGKKELSISGNPNVTLQEGDFTFKLEGVGDVPMPNDTATNDATGGFAFEKITFKAPGTYQYKVSEVNEGKKGYTYDQTVYDVTIVVEDEDGELTVTKNTSGVDKIVFHNSYKPESVTLQGDTVIKGTKSLSGREMKAEEFGFVIATDQSNAPMPAETTVKNTEEGTLAFGPITFTEVGVYKYVITEEQGTSGGVIYDDQEFVVEVKVTDAGGYLVADVTYPQNGIVFSNTYKATNFATVTLDARKNLEGRDLKEGEFTFRMVDKTGNTVLIATNRVDGVVQFGTLIFEEPGVYEYTVQEVAGDAKFVTYDTEVYQVRIQVEDDLQGTLKADKTITKNGSTVEQMEFNNTYQVVSPPTGDTTSYSSVLLGLFFAVVCVVAYFVKNRITI